MGWPMTDSPTFTCTFVGGETTRMSVSTPTTALDVGRGVRLSIAAYESRMRMRRRENMPPRQRKQTDDTPIEIPSIVEARFETAAGDILRNYSTEDLACLTAPESGSRS